MFFFNFFFFTEHYRILFLENRTFSENVFKKFTNYEKFMKSDKVQRTSFVCTFKKIFSPNFYFFFFFLKFCNYHQPRELNISHADIFTGTVCPQPGDSSKTEMLIAEITESFLYVH